MGFSNSYVDQYAARLGAGDVQKFTSGNTAAEVANLVVPNAIAQIDDGTDTRAVIVQLGGQDYLRGNCRSGWNRPDCDYADGLNAVLIRLRAALDRDPGDEQLFVVAYYNPASGLGNETERFFDAGLRGADGRIDTSAHGGDWGQTDVIAWLACRNGATFVDPWSAFKAGGQSLMLDQLHPNATGQAILAGLLADPAAGGPAPTCAPTTPFADTSPDAGDGRAHGVVEPRLAAARWWFEYGATTAYGQSTPVRDLPASAGTRAVTEDLPMSRPNTRFHVRLVVENDVGRAVGDDRLVTTPGPPKLRASVPGSALRGGILARGVAMRIFSTGTSVTVGGRLMRSGRDPRVLFQRLPWTAGTKRTIRIALTRRGRSLVKHARRPRLGLRLFATGRGGASRPIQLSLRLR